MSIDMDNIKDRFRGIKNRIIEDGYGCAVKVYCAFLICMVVFLIVGAIFYDKKKGGMINDDYHNFDKGWKVEKTGEIIDLPSKVPMANDSSIRITKKIDFRYYDDLFLAVCTQYQSLKVIVDDKSVEELSRSSYSDVWNFIKVKREYIGKELTLVYIPDKAEDNIQLSSVMYGKKADIKMDLLKKDFYMFIIVIILMSIMTFLLLLKKVINNTDNRVKLDCINNMLIIFCFLTLLRTYLLQYIYEEYCLQSVEMLTFIMTMMIPLAPYIFILNASEEFDDTKEAIIDGFQKRKLSSREKVQKFSKKIFQGNIIFICVATFLWIFVEKDKTMMFYMRQLKFVPNVVGCIYICIISFISTGNCKEKKQKRTRIAISIAAAALLYNEANIIFSGKQDDIRISIVSMAFLMIILSYSIIKSLFDLIRQVNQTKEWKEKASIDALTKTLTRIAYVDYVDNLKAEELKNKAVVSIDINNLKKINDTHGHVTGDRYIVKVVEIIKGMCRDGMCYRIGGDEFILIFDNMDNEKMKELSKRFDEFLFKQEYFEGYIMSFAYGYEIFEEARDTNLYETVKRADAKMYEHKAWIKEKLGISR